MNSPLGPQFNSTSAAVEMEGVTPSSDDQVKTILDPWTGKADHSDRET